MLLKAFIVPVVYLDFKLNQEYIAEVLCINRDKPIIVCGGKCYLTKQLKKTQETEQSPENQTSKKQYFETFCERLFNFDILSFATLQKEYLSCHLLLITSHFWEIFHPPKLLR